MMKVNILNYCCIEMSLWLYIYTLCLIYYHIQNVVQKEIELELSNNGPRRSSNHSQERGEGTRRKFLHHWIAGNLPLNSECEVCEEACGDGPGIVDLRCCWCQR